MSPWDRKAEIARYERMFEITPDEQALIEELGTPTKVAVGLARDYVATPPPEEPSWLPPAVTEAVSPPEEDSEVPEEAPPVTPPSPPPPPKPKPQVRGAGVFLFVLLALVVGLPVTVVLICLGVPFLVAGVGCVVVALEQIIRSFGLFNLFSDMLLVGGAGLAAAGIGLLLSWFGIWLSMSLCRLWIEKALVPLGTSLCLKKEVAQDG